MPKKKTTKADKNQPSLYGDVDELYHIMSSLDEPLKDALEAAEKRIESAKEKIDEITGLRTNLRKGMKIIERRREELQPKPEKKKPGPKADAKKT